MGGGFRMGNTGIPMADSSQCMAKPIKYCKVKKKKKTAAQKTSTGLAGVNQSILQGRDSCDSLEDWKGPSSSKDGSKNRTQMREGSRQL